MVDVCFFLFYTHLKCKKHVEMFSLSDACSCKCVKFDLCLPVQVQSRSAKLCVYIYIYCGFGVIRF